MTLERAADGSLVLGQVPLEQLAEEYGTPLYVMDVATLRARMGAWERALAGHGAAFYAGKAFLCRAMATLAAQEGLSLDVVSGGELYTALQGGMDPERIAWHGNVKTAEEMSWALRSGVGHVVVDSVDEVPRLAEAARALGRRQPVWIRLNPDVDTDTHAFIQTGHADSKFGLSLKDGSAEDAIRQIRAASHLHLTGYHAHIGSQLREVAPYLESARRLMTWAVREATATGFWPAWMDLGGGMAVAYEPGEPELYPEDLVPQLLTVLRDGTPQDRERPRLAMEPGRSIAAPAGVTLYRVEGRKTLFSGRRCLMVDGGMGDNIRPTLYQARYHALAVKGGGDTTEPVTLAGRYCETGDVVIADAHLPEMAAGDLVAVLMTGAYNYAMASNYNRVPRPAVVAVEDGQAQIWVRRETWDDLVRLDAPLVT